MLSYKELAKQGLYVRNEWNGPSGPFQKFSILTENLGLMQKGVRVSQGILPLTEQQMYFRSIFTRWLVWTAFSQVIALTIFPRHATQGIRISTLCIAVETGNCLYHSFCLLTFLHFSQCLFELLGREWIWVNIHLVQPCRGNKTKHYTNEQFYL